MTTRAYNVSGMTGGHCVTAVSSAIAGVTGVSDVDVDLARGIAIVTAVGPIDDGAIREAVEEAGYEFAPLP